jgi:hypothetical protein
VLASAGVAFARTPAAIEVLPAMAWNVALRFVS